MTSISSLVNYKNHISRLRNNSSLRDSIMVSINEFNNTSLLELPEKDIINKLLNIYDNLYSSSIELYKTLDDIISMIDTSIDTMCLEAEKDPSYRDKFNEFSWPVGTLDPYDTGDQQHLKDLQQQLTLHTIWQYPGLQLYPQSKQWTDIMLASEPVYLVALNKGLLHSIIEPYPALYQNRLRLYATGLNETIVDRSLKFLPQNQFGYVVMWNISLYLLSEYLEQYLRSIFDILRPGGICVVNFNNCDILSSAKLAEDGIFSFMTTRIIKKMCEDIGFESIIFKDVELNNVTYSHMSWVELRKAGVLTTSKLHPTMAKIIE